MWEKLTPIEVRIAKYLKQICQQWDLNIMIDLSSNDFVVRNYRGDSLSDYWLDKNWMRAHFNTLWDVIDALWDDLYVNTYEFYKSLVRNGSRTINTQTVLTFLVNGRVKDVLRTIDVARCKALFNNPYPPTEVTADEINWIMRALWNSVIQEDNFYYIN